MVSETPDVLPYCCGVVESVGLGQCGGWWRRMWRGGWRGLGGAVVVVACGVWQWGFPGWLREGGLLVVCVGGGWGWWGLMGVSVCCVGGPVPGGGGDGFGVALLVVRVWASRRVLWALCVCDMQVSRPLPGRGVEVGGGHLGIRVGLWFVGS